MEEIKLPLIGLGLVDSIEEVEELVELVDEDGSGEVEFNEFVDIILNKCGDEKADTITTFFKNLTSGVYETRSLSFTNWVLKERRSHLINAILLDKNDERRVKGRSILKAMKTELKAEKFQKQISAAENAVSQFLQKTFSANFLGQL